MLVAGVRGIVAREHFARSYEEPSCGVCPGLCRPFVELSTPLSCREKGGERLVDAGCARENRRDSEVKTKGQGTRPEGKNVQLQLQVQVQEESRVRRAILLEGKNGWCTLVVEMWVTRKKDFKMGKTPSLWASISR